MASEVADRVKRVAGRDVRIACAAGLLLASMAAAPPMFMQPEALPVARLIDNLGRHLEERPDDPQLLYHMARLHYLALANQSHLVPAFERPGQAPAPAPPHLAQRFLWSLRWDEADRRARQALGFDDRTSMDPARFQALDARRREVMEALEAEGWRPPAPGMDELHRHAEQAAVHFDRAIAAAAALAAEPGTDPPRRVEARRQEALFRLGRASLGEQCLQLELQGKLPRRRLIEPLAELSPSAVRDEYHRAYALAVDTDLERGLPVEGLMGVVSHEAGAAYLRLCDASQDLRRGQQERIETVRRGVERLKAMPMRIVTPILVGRRGDDRLADLLDPGATVTFDLDGDGTREAWPWVRPQTGILVWSPGGQPIESGHQLFGSVTWFLFHRDGYQALALLDGNRDGELTDLELDGLGIWRDEDGDGRSQPAELQPVWRAGIASIRTDGRILPDGVLGHPAGVRYRDGSARPTFDWVTAPRD